MAARSDNMRLFIATGGDISDNHFDFSSIASSLRYYFFCVKTVHVNLLTLTISAKEKAQRVLGDVEHTI